MNNNVKIFCGVVGLMVVALIVTAIFRSSPTATGPGVNDQFAQCLNDKGATFYGAFWCPHCQNTKKLFGSSVKLLPYVECSTPDAKGQTQACIDKSIQSYPTWEFADGSRLTGELTLAQLSEKTGCPLPGTETAPVPTTDITPTANSSSSAVTQ